jgi:hypothetical protein
MLCEATVVTALETGREPLALGRRKRRATKGQRRALVRRDGGCARPGCPEARIERLHVHHMRHWLFGGRTDLSNLVLLCDADHGLVHELDLVMSRRGGRLIVTARDGRRVWGAADAAFTRGRSGIDTDVPAEDEHFVGVHPIDVTTGRRPSLEPAPDAAGPHPTTPTPEVAGRTTRRHRAVRRRGGPAGATPRSTGRGTRRGNSRPRTVSPGRRPVDGRRPTPTRPNPPVAGVAAISDGLFPGGEPVLAEVMPVGGERMDVRYVVGVLMGNRDLARRLAAENGVNLTP